MTYQILKLTIKTWGLRPIPQHSIPPEAVATKNIVIFSPPAPGQKFRGMNLVRSEAKKLITS